ncbi:MAG: preprotein translocase subunit YajC [Acutalibacteraceae bacterium]|nr:preprotein translocase subunit YajC [Acutalibacteraceae bacterium]
MNFNFYTLETAADSTASSKGGLIFMILIYALIFGAMYLLLIRPQRKKQKEEKKMRENLMVGDEIVTIGGIYGRVISLKEDTIVIESNSDHSKLTVARWALQSNLTVHDDTASK